MDDCEHYFFIKEGEPDTVYCVYCGHEEPLEENEMLKL